MKMKENKQFLIYTVLLLSFVLVFFSNDAFALSMNSVRCNSGAAKRIQAAGQAAYKRDKSEIQKAQQAASNIENSSAWKAVKSCAGITNPTKGFSLPSLGNIMKNIGRSVKNAACSKARGAIHSAVGSYTQSINVNTGVPGIGNIGGSIGANENSITGGINLPGSSANVNASSGF